jgi:hypothetical protein
MHGLGLLEAILVLSVAAFNYFFFSMNRILRGKWYRLSPTWQWPRDIRQIRRLVQTAETDQVRHNCKVTLCGIYISGGCFLLALILGI